ncbi:XK-related protein 8 [Danio rerio]|uniref:XK-related protein n=1 Tax=Danio rerio TaxID=7955 RepID=E7F1M2_DANRE|nr:XK-related protein 8-like [Danio rerio]|eukprot:XP_005170156.1 XK-related protein 8-like [Danio rerio]
MEASSTFHYSFVYYLFTWIGLFLFLLDIVMDIRTVVSLYQEEAYVFMGLMIFFLVGSSVLLQVFSWIWYSDSLDELETEVEKFTKEKKLIKPFHFLQLGVYLRYAGVIEMSTKLFLQQRRIFKESTFLNLDFQLLGLFETFTESAPQLILMATLMLQRGELQLFSGLKFLASAASIAFTLAMYHNGIRANFDVKCWTASAIYLLWNILLIITRVAVLALFCSVFPCHIVAHFLSLWMVLVFVAWRQKTDFMESSGWQWLFKATVGLIWYFSWFNISESNTNLNHAVYCIFLLLDMMMLLGFWSWKVTEYAGSWTSLNPTVIIPTILGLYIIGNLVMMMNYKWFYTSYKQKIEELSNKIKEGKIKKVRPLGYRAETETVDKVPGVLLRSRTMAADFYF